MAYCLFRKQLAVGLVWDKEALPEPEPNCIYTIAYLSDNPYMLDNETAS